MRKEIQARSHVSYFSNIVSGASKVNDAAIAHGSMLACLEKVRRLAGPSGPVGPDFASGAVQRDQAVGQRREGRRQRPGQQRSGQNVSGDSPGVGVRNSPRC